MRREAALLASLGILRMLVLRRIRTPCCSVLEFCGAGGERSPRLRSWHPVDAGLGSVRRPSGLGGTLGFGDERLCSCLGRSASEGCRYWSYAPLGWTGRRAGSCALRCVNASLKAAERRRIVELRSRHLRQTQQREHQGPGGDISADIHKKFRPALHPAGTVNCPRMLSQLQRTPVAGFVTIDQFSFNSKSSSHAI